jgi:phage tail sheath protein FI
MATAYLSPGVYVEEVSSGSKPIEGVGTAVAAFIGFAESGPVGQPTLVTNWSQFTKTFGGFVDGGYLAHSVYGYFNNGGGIAYVTRLPGEIANGNGKDGKAKQPETAALPSRGAGALPTLEFTALEAGAGDISVEVRAAEAGAPEDQFTVVVKRGAAEEQFPNVTLGKGRNTRNVVEVVNKESKLVKVAERESTGTLLERAPAVGNYQLAKVEPSALAVQSASTASRLPTTSPCWSFRTSWRPTRPAPSPKRVCVPSRPPCWTTAPT